MPAVNRPTMNLLAALAGNHTLATRNVTDFDGIPGLHVVNAFE